jgi:hypothetical protein
MSEGCMLMASNNTNLPTLTSSSGRTISDAYANRTARPFSTKHKQAAASTTFRRWCDAGRCNQTASS